MKSILRWGSLVTALAVLFSSCATYIVKREPLPSKNPARDERSVSSALPSVVNQEKTVFLYDNKKYSSRFSAYTKCIVDSFIGAAGLSLLTGLAASAFSSKEGTFKRWANNSFYVTLPIGFYGTFSSVEKKKFIYYRGDWIDPAAAKLEKYEGEWLTKEEVAFKKANAADTLEAYEDFLKSYPDGTLKERTLFALDRLTWNSIQAAGRIEDYKQYLRQFPNGLHTGEAQQKVNEEELGEWEKAKAIGTPESYQQFLERYPKGVFAQDAKSKIFEKERQAWEKAKTAGTMAAFIEYRNMFPKGLFVDQIPQEEDYWKKVDGINPASLESFLRDFPDGRNAEEARLLLSLHRKLDALRLRKEKAAFVIPFSRLGNFWTDWKDRNPEKGAVGYMAERRNIGVAVGSFKVLPGEWTLMMGSQGIAVAPTGEGSIIAFRTDGLEYEWINDIIIQCQEKETLYFGVVTGMGLVYLNGRGKVIFAAGQETALPPVQAK